MTTTTILPYQEGDSICDLEASTKIINNSDSVETNTDNRTIHAREVFMGHDGETENQRQARERRSKLKQGRQHRARQCKEAWIKYESDLAEYDRRKSEQEVEERRTANTPHNRIREALEELGATSHPSE